MVRDCACPYIGGSSEALQGEKIRVVRKNKSRKQRREIVLVCGKERVTWFLSGAESRRNIRGSKNTLSSSSFENSRDSTPRISSIDFVFFTSAVEFALPLTGSSNSRQEQPIEVGIPSNTIPQISLHKILHHPNIARLEYIGTHPEDHFVRLGFEYVGVDLRKFQRDNPIRARRPKLIKSNRRVIGDKYTVELLVTYEGSRFVVNDLKLPMDTFHRVDFTGTWRRLFSRVKKHIIWGVLKSVTGMQGKKFKDKAHSQREENPLGLIDNEGQAGKSDQYPLTWLKRPSDGSGDGFVTSIRGLFNTQRRKAKAFVLRKMRGEADTDLQGDWSGSDVELSPFARQLTITKVKRLIRRHTKKFHSRAQKASSSQQKESLPSSPRETTPFESDSSSGTSPYEDFHD
ncbi:hypothetical protein G4B88_002799 [Cannabis sativa]|uniref:Uncharacterized protein n=1 Tax=Cannabis sativa TaxID=3483 RepID=A0A7J6HI32_CANSA|nr:hypothetical protein G4B88_002799 [Cannabis sativa]